jgi:hypothetical protein
MNAVIGGHASLNLWVILDPDMLMTVHRVSWQYQVPEVAVQWRAGEPFTLASQVPDTAITSALAAAPP